MNEQNSKVIYILTNPSFPEYVKIGYADNLEKRLRELNGSCCTPFAFRAFATYTVESRLADLDVHTMIDSLNPKLRSIDFLDGKERKREFYAISPESAYKILLTIAKISNTRDKLKIIAPTEADKKNIISADMIRENSENELDNQDLDLSLIAKDDILFATAFIDKCKIPANFLSSVRFAVINGKSYAPKYTVAVAYLHTHGVNENEIANKISRDKLLGRFRTHNAIILLKTLGFYIENKSTAE
ncbi:MAG: GIY-YIG nuclease family protein [Christensenellaceae bacterium]|jgi:hypothetical protein|nr:GIY-YIG nuclease family protein [Christensenellaceae bacterium]